MIAALCADLAEKQRTLEASAAAARDAATHEESKPENDKDTRALEASYLAGAQAGRARELKALQNALSFLPLRAFAAGDAIAEAALVEVHGGGRKSVYFIAPHGGGLKARVAGVDVTVIAPDAPLGQALVGKCAGDEVEANGRALTIVAVR
ncbi:MAG: transcription elongation factor GreAB [Deltaproteobacteria bacterium]|nr:transcription elongation factor GreAB [Deltaproteobacteria bacterium]